jgi:hypothetical protein
MSRTATAIELVEYPHTPIASTVTQPASIYPKEERTLSHSDHVPLNVSDVEQLQAPGKKTTAIVLVTVVCVTMISSMLSGVTVVVLPTMARDLQLAPSMLLWYHVRFPSIRLMSNRMLGQCLSTRLLVVARFYSLARSQTSWARDPCTS